VQESMWEWKSKSPPPSTEASVTGGNLFGNLKGGTTSREASGHGGSLFGSSPSREGSTHGSGRRRTNFADLAGVGELADDPTRSVPKSRDSSAHGGNLFSSAMGLAGLGRPKAVRTDNGASPTATRGLPRRQSWVWDWVAGSTPSTPDGSVHGDAQFPTDITDAQGDAAERKESPTATVGVLRRGSSASFLWDWGKYRGSPPQTPGPSPGNSVEGGDVFSPSATKKVEGSKTLGIELPRTLTRGLSRSSLMWSWGKKEPEPDAKTQSGEEDDDDDIPKIGNQSLG